MLKMIQDLQRELAASQKQQQQTAEKLEALKSQLEENTASVENVSQETQQIVKKFSQQVQPVRTASVVANNPQPDPQPGLSGSLPIFPNALWHIAGYADANYRATTGDEDREGKINSFLAARFNPVFHFTYKDFLLAEAELEFEVGEDGETEVALEYASIDWLATDWLAFVAGKFLSPVGFWQQNLHPSWINKLPDAPAGFGHGGVAPLSDLGLMARGGFGKVGHPLLNYGVYVGNGPQLEFEDGNLAALEQVGFGLDDNNDKAVGGRVGIVPIPHLEIGGSFEVAQVQGKKNVGPAEDVLGPVTDGQYTLWGVDAGYTKDPWNIRGEYIHAELDSFWSQKVAGGHEAAAVGDEPVHTMLIPATEWSAWYAQVAYRLSKLNNPILQNVEFVSRYGQYRASGFEHFVEHARPEDRTTIGLNYWLSSSAVLKSAVSWRDFTAQDNIDSTEYRAQFAYGF